MKHLTQKPSAIRSPKSWLLKGLLLLTLFAILTTACQTTTDPAATASAEPNAVAKPLRIDAIMAPFTPAKQTFTVGSDKPSLVKGKAGTKIHVEPSRLTMPDGSPVKGDIEVSLIECTRKSELLGAGLQTMSDGKILESGGSYFVDMQAGGQPLAIKPGQSIEVEFPQMTDKKMELFYGDKDAVGQMNWKAAEVDFQPSKQQEVESPGIVVPSKAMANADLSSDTMYAYISGGDTIQSTSLDDILAYMEQEDGNAYSKDRIKNYNQEKGNLKPKAKMTREERNQQAMLDRRSKAEAAEKQRQAVALSEANRAEQMRAQRAATANQPPSNSTYIGVNLNRFGWYNCDRFMNESNNLQFAVKLPAAAESGTVYFVLRGKNAIIQSYYGPGENPVTSAQLPVGQYLDVFVVQGTDKDGQMDFAHAKAKVGDPVLDLKPTATAISEIKAAFDAI